MRTPSDHAIKSAWVRYFGNARLIRQEADIQLGLPVSPDGPQRHYASRSDIDDPEPYARRLLEAAGDSISRQPLAHTGTRFARPAGTPHLQGGISPIPLWRTILVHCDQWDDHAEHLQPGGTIDWSLAAASGSQALSARFAHNSRNTTGTAHHSEWVPVQYEIAAGATGVCIAGNEFIVTGRYTIQGVHGSVERPRALHGRAVNHQAYGIHVTVAALTRPRTVPAHSQPLASV